jgi:hypothetical protein
MSAEDEGGVDRMIEAVTRMFWGLAAFGILFLAIYTFAWLILEAPEWGEKVLGGVMVLYLAYVVGDFARGLFRGVLHDR